MQGRQRPSEARQHQRGRHLRPRPLPLLRGQRRQGLHPLPAGPQVRAGPPASQGCLQGILFEHPVANNIKLFPRKVINHGQTSFITLVPVASLREC
jgi:hypothetical protein